MFIIEITSPHGQLYPCPKCNRSFISIRALGGHKRGHTLRERKEITDLATDMENPGAANPNFQGDALTVSLGKAPISEPESETDWSGIDSDSEFESFSDSDSGSDYDVKPQLDNHGHSNSLVIRYNANANPNPNPRPSSGKGKGLLDVPNSPSTPKYCCPICDKSIQGAYALWRHVSRAHKKNYKGSNGASSSSKVRGIEGDSDEEA